MLTTTEMKKPAAMMRPLQGRTALVTGSTSGIGLGVAEALAREGATIVLNGFGDRMQIEDTRQKLEQTHNVAAFYHGADLSKAAAVGEMMDYAKAQAGGVDILVNNAGIQHVAPVDEFPPEKWDAILAINLSSAFHAIRAALPGMKARGYGRIINVASAHGLVASPYKSAYVAAKHGVIGLTKTVALEVAQANITANAICPGYVYTPLVEKQIEDQAKAHMIPREKVISDVLLKAQPNKRFAQVTEIGALAVFLASEAASSITGTALPVDGGWTAH
ncbi:3-hydroxybutyrate dehydrogenase [Vitreimonas sp.]|uniref:3-hydroxybutyrate dehydrogenase n=1 Tax=Vitreimonas sp. TaxID=3069702 RepID=UPI002EDA6969